MLQYAKKTSLQSKFNFTGIIIINYLCNHYQILTKKIWLFFRNSVILYYPHYSAKSNAML